MKKFFDGTFNNLLVPLVVAALIGIVSFYVSVQINQATMAQRLDSHLELPAHPSSSREMGEARKDISVIKQNMIGIEQKIDMSHKMILNEIKALSKELDRARHPYPR